MSQSSATLSSSQFQQLGPGLHFHKPTRLLLQTNTKPVRFLDPKHVAATKPALFDEYRYIDFDDPQGWTWSELYAGFSAPEKCNFSLMEANETFLSLMVPLVLGLCGGCGTFCFRQMTYQSPEDTEEYRRHLTRHPRCGGKKVKTVSGFACSLKTPTYFVLKSYKKTAKDQSSTNSPLQNGVRSSPRHVIAPDRTVETLPVSGGTAAATTTTATTRANGTNSSTPSTLAKVPNPVHTTAPELPNTSGDSTPLSAGKRLESLRKTIKTPPKEPLVSMEVEQEILARPEFTQIGPSLHYHKPTKLILITGRWPTRLFDPLWSSASHLKNLLHKEYVDMGASSWSDLYSSLQDPENHNFEFVDIHPILKAVLELKNVALCKGCGQMAFNFSASRLRGTTPYIRHLERFPACNGAQLQLVKGYLVSMKPRTFFVVKDSFGDTINSLDLDKGPAPQKKKSGKQQKRVKPLTQPIHAPVVQISKESQNPLSNKPKPIILPSQREVLGAPFTQRSTPTHAQDGQSDSPSRRPSDTVLAGPSVKRIRVVENSSHGVNESSVTQMQPPHLPSQALNKQGDPHVRQPPPQQHQYLPQQEGVSWSESILSNVSQELEAMSSSTFHPPRDPSFEQAWTQLHSALEPTSLNIFPFMLLSCVKDHLHQTFQRTNSFRCIISPTHPQLDITDIHSTLRISLQLSRTPGLNSTWSVKGNSLADPDTHQKANKFLQLDRFEAENMSFVEVCEFIVVQMILYRSVLNAVSETGYIPSKRELSEVMWSCIDDAQVDGEKAVRLLKCELASFMGFFPV